MPDTTRKEDNDMQSRKPTRLDPDKARSMGTQADTSRKPADLKKYDLRTEKRPMKSSGRQ